MHSLSLNQQYPATEAMFQCPCRYQIYLTPQATTNGKQPRGKFWPSHYALEFSLEAPRSIERAFSIVNIKIFIRPYEIRLEISICYLAASFIAPPDCHSDRDGVVSRGSRRQLWVCRARRNALSTSIPFLSTVPVPVPCSDRLF